jgi:hypothetical protein
MNELSELDEQSSVDISMILAEARWLVVKLIKYIRIYTVRKCEMRYIYEERIKNEK